MSRSANDHRCSQALCFLIWVEVMLVLVALGSSLP